MSDVVGTACVGYLDDGAAGEGPGWYWWDEEYPHAGVCGPFADEQAARASALEMAYESVITDCTLSFPVATEKEGST